MKRVSVCLLIFPAALVFGLVSAQTLAQTSAQKSAQTGADKSSVLKLTGELKISASDSFLWDRNQKTLIAEGNVVLIHKDKTFYADKMVSYYREDTKDSRDFYKILATGHVRLLTTEHELIGSRLSYDVATQIATMIGKSRVISRK